MSLNYVSDTNGEKVAVQIPIEDWNRVRDNYPDIDTVVNGETPQWQIELMSERLDDIEKNTGRLRPMADLNKTLNKKIG